MHVAHIQCTNHLPYGVHHAATYLDSRARMSLKICDGKSVEEFEKCRTCKIISAKEMHFQVHFCGVGLRDDDDEIEDCFVDFIRSRGFSPCSR